MPTRLVRYIGAKFLVLTTHAHSLSNSPINLGAVCNALMVALSILNFVLFVPVIGPKVCSKMTSYVPSRSQNCLPIHSA